MKTWVQFLLCVLLSAGVWLTLNLSQDYVSMVSVPVVAVSNIEGRAGVSTSEATATAQVTATGFQHVFLGRKHKRPVMVTFSAADFRYEQEDMYAISNTSLYRYASQIFGDGVTVDSFISEDLMFSFPEETYRKVPVRPVLSVTYDPQFMALKPMTLQPDSVLVYGEPSRLENIQFVLTKPLELTELRSSVHGKVRLEVPSSVRLSHEESIYSMEVTRYVEIASEVRIGTRHVPSGVHLAVLPSTAVVVYRCVFPMTTDPTLNASFYIDYRDFAGSRTGRCMVHSEGIPSNVIDFTVSPEVFDCLVKEVD
ncbi:MAG: YbbR-like domain-containing protein [Bacteroidales bacterium]|nr:YbbR-like domain-containing protein [Bacteroidales bacterium]